MAFLLVVAMKLDREKEVATRVEEFLKGDTFQVEYSVTIIAVFVHNPESYG